MYKVLWLLGAYTEFVKLTCIRKCATSREDYYAQVQTLCLTGGGFDEYQILADKVDTLIERVDVKNKLAVDQAVAEITDLFLAIEWLPNAFRETLKGKAYLPKNKLSWKLLKHHSGFMGKGEFRQHFFNNNETIDLLLSFLSEKINYSTVSIVRKKAGHKSYLSFS